MSERVQYTERESLVLVRRTTDEFSIEYALLNARLRQYMNYNIQFSTGNNALAVDSESGRFNLTGFAQ